MQTHRSSRVVIERPAKIVTVCVCVVSRKVAHGDCSWWVLIHHRVEYIVCWHKTVLKCLNGLVVWFLLWVSLNCRRSPIRSRVEAFSFCLIWCCGHPVVQMCTFCIFARTHQESCEQKFILWLLTSSFDAESTLFCLHVLTTKNIHQPQTWPKSIL
jgi:hypothetical protein